MGEVRQVQFGKSTTKVQGASESQEQGNVVDMGAFKIRRSLTSDRKVSIGEAFSGLSPSHPARSASSGASASGTDVELSERIERIKSSINRINQLMTELKTVSKDDEPK